METTRPNPQTYYAPFSQVAIEQARENRRQAREELARADWYNPYTMQIMLGNDGIVYLVDAGDNTKIIKQWGKRIPDFTQRRTGNT